MKELIEVNFNTFVLILAGTFDMTCADSTSLHRNVFQIISNKRQTDYTNNNGRIYNSPDYIVLNL